MIYTITDEPTEKIELKVEDDKFAIVHTLKPSQTYATIILNRKEALKLYQALKANL